MPRIKGRLRAVGNSRWWERSKSVLSKASRSYIVIVILGVLVGLQIAPVVGPMASSQTSGDVMVIPIFGGIDGQSSAQVVAQLREARDDPSIKAVVLQINSGGGSVAPSEEMYMAISETADEMPVVAAVDAIAASGAYHAAVGADKIYVKPGSLIGNVGVFMTLPQDLPPVDFLIATGPEKLTGADQRDWYYKVEGMKNSFVNAVMTNRGDALVLSRADVASGEMWTGSEAINNGIADEYGTVEDAIDSAAEQADLSRYSVSVRSPQEPVLFVTNAAFVSADVDRKDRVDPSYFVGTPETIVAPHAVMLPPSVVKTALVRNNLSAVTTEGVNTNATVAP